mmetsp:Transcript_25992/g.72598  ORF Transcript_25992/g.72598 Transcript_25992/m.72598 type:complete len:197 (+) Transcript_25992:119-709(+)|eukprot:CAMPEP_0117528676 /NCGR_PEP_ID=MMETSP0784-20121206/37437_1 /TAXON_ID=39447 /ORGANISM="" /LENGTH=196 /DNA_ID=CAMNT_0005324969 /DNA_START=119 /DNA_END=709 /DNA_ORIENTATION=+
MSLVTGGTGGLGMIASYHMAAEYGLPIVATSRSGRFSTPGTLPMQLLEAIQNHTLHFSVKCDVANAQELHDLLDVLARGIATGRDEQTAQVDQVVAAVNRKMNILPAGALKSLLDLMSSTEARLQQAIIECRDVGVEKVDQAHLQRLQQQEVEVAETIATLKDRIAAAAAPDPEEEQYFRPLSEAAESVASQLSRT